MVSLRTSENFHAQSSHTLKAWGWSETSGNLKRVKGLEVARSQAEQSLQILFHKNVMVALNELTVTRGLQKLHLHRRELIKIMMLMQQATFDLMVLETTSCHV